LERGISLSRVAASIAFSFSQSPKIFTELSKLRAARLIWAAVLKQYREDPTPLQEMQILAQSSFRERTINNPLANLVRGTLEALSGVLGGADAVMVLPWDHVKGEGSYHGLRWARNTLLLLKEEAFPRWIEDSLGGSYFVEAQTDAIARGAWEAVQQILGMGGMKEALHHGYIQAQIKQTSIERRNRIAARESVVVGANKYILLKDEEAAFASTGGFPLEKSQWDFKAVGMNESEWQKIDSIIASRSAEPFEKIQVRTQEWVKNNVGNRSGIALILGGAPLACKHNVDFAIEYFASGGLPLKEMIQLANFEETEQLVLRLNPAVVAFCFAGDEDLASVQSMALRLHRSDAALKFYWIGKPTTSQIEKELIHSGISRFIYRGSDTVAILREIQEEVCA